MSLFRRGAAKPTTVALIFTPLQAINLLEYAETTGHQPALILVGNSSNSRNREHITEVLDGVDVNVRQIAGHSGLPRPGPRQDAALAELAFHLAAIDGPVRMVFGDYRSTLAWRLIRMLDICGDQVVFVDDGAATLSIDRVDRANDSIPWESLEAVAPTYGPGLHRVTTASHTYTEPSEKAPKVKVLAEGDRIVVTAVARVRDRLWGIDPQGEFIRMGHVLWDAPLPEGTKVPKVDLGGGTPWESSSSYAAVAVATFFTSYPKQLRAEPEDIVIANDFPRLKRFYRELDVDPDHVIVIGSPLQGIGLSADRLRDYILELLALARAARPDAEVVYVPHRAETDDDIAYLAGKCKVERFELPFELVPLKVGHLPSLCATFYSSLALNLLDLAGDRLTVLSLRIDPEDYDESRRETVQRVYERIATHPSGTTQVVDSAG